MNLAPAGPALIDAPTLVEALRGTPAPVVLDASFDLADPASGEASFRAGHIPGAVYVHLEQDLSAPKQGPDGRFRGRHPLPGRAEFAARVGRWGIVPGRLVVAVDRQGGIMAARAWWMLRWLGHAEVAVLDGGMAAWTAAGGRLETLAATPPAAAPYPLSAQAGAGPAMPTIEADELLRQLGRLGVLDARAPERFRGEVEPLDACAGHIPGARNRFFKDNLGPDGRFKPAAVLREEFMALLAGRSPDELVQQCGSGVTACHNLLAMEWAGLPGSRLYPGSWSEWSAEPTRPVARG
jgi:thiosulfate/3-mercaptopyruvate sulfurtransferase